MDSRVQQHVHSLQQPLDLLAGLNLVSLLTFCIMQDEIFPLWGRCPLFKAHNMTCDSYKFTKKILSYGGEWVASKTGPSWAFKLSPSQDTGWKSLHRSSQLRPLQMAAWGGGANFNKNKKLGLLTTFYMAISMTLCPFNKNMCCSDSNNKATEEEDFFQMGPFLLVCDLCHIHGSTCWGASKFQTLYL